MRELTRRLIQAGINDPGGDVRRLVAGTLGISAADVLRMPERPLGAAEFQLLEASVERRRRREPVSRILGRRDFYGRTFAISGATLDPRPDSETLIGTALEAACEEGWMAQPIRILDVGTGSGCLLLSLLAELPLATGVGTDISPGALATASCNARRFGFEKRAAWIEADGLESIACPFHMLIANPPYVRSADIAGLDPEVREFDPVEALDGGPDGLSFYRRMVRRIATIVPAGWVVLEVGRDQADEVAALLISHVSGVDRSRIRIRRDVAGIRRCVAARTLG